MTASVTNHEVPDDPRNDPDHPIPNLNVIDVAGYKKTGGADLSIIIASPLAGDPASQTRLLDKIQGYLSHIQSPEFLADSGVAPDPSNTTINVILHPGSSNLIRELLERCHAWANEHGASLAVRDFEPGELGGT